MKRESIQERISALGRLRGAAFAAALGRVPRRYWNDCRFGVNIGGKEAVADRPSLRQERAGDGAALYLRVTTHDGAQELPSGKIPDNLADEITCNIAAHAQASYLRERRQRARRRQNERTRKLIQA